MLGKYFAIYDSYLEFLCVYDSLVISQLYINGILVFKLAAFLYEFNQNEFRRLDMAHSTLMNISFVSSSIPIFCRL